MPRKIRGLQNEQVPVKLHQNGSACEVRVPVYSLRETRRVNSVWFLGFGAGSMAARNVLEAQRQSRLLGAAVTLPYAHVPYAHMEGFTNEVVPQVIEGIDSTDQVVLAGDSRGAGAGIRGAAQAPELIKAAGFLEPVFLTTMGKPEHPVRELVRRLVVNLPRLEQPFHPGAVQTATGMFEELSTVALTQGTRNLVRAMELVTDPGIVDRTVASLGIIAANHIPMRAWIGKYDPVAPFDELQATLPANLHDLLVRVPAAHVAMGTPEGFAQAQIVADFLAPSFPTSYYRL